MDAHEMNEADFIWTIPSIKRQLQRKNFVLLSEVFPLNRYPWGAQAKLTLDDDNYLQISVSYQDLNNDSNALSHTPFPFVHFTYKASKNIFREHTTPFNTAPQYDEFKYSQWLLLSSAIVSDVISIDIQWERPESAAQGYSYDGSLTWAIDDYRNKMEMEHERLMWYYPSPYFYTSPEGYRVRAKMWLNGNGNYKGLIVSIDFLTGPYDAQLSISFKHTTTVTLLHPTDPSKFIVKSVEKDLEEDPGYKIDMATHEEIDQLLDGDTLYYQITIIPA